MSWIQRKRLLPELFSLLPIILKERRDGHLVEQVRLLANEWFTQLVNRLVKELGVLVDQELPYFSEFAFSFG